MKILVYIIASDNWSGQQIIETKTFKTLRVAKAFIKRHNARNNLPRVPEYYTFAQLATDSISRT